jgi:hypothetical protein
MWGALRGMLSNTSRIGFGRRFKVVWNGCCQLEGKTF